MPNNDTNATTLAHVGSTAELGGKNPRLRREWSLTCKRLMWVCRGGIARGMADNPKDAYWCWKYYEKKLSHHLLPNTPISGGTSAA
jgi:hypothetical protein